MTTLWGELWPYNKGQFRGLFISLGTSQATKSADFLVLDANPLDNITNTRKISCVYLRGAEGDRAPFRVTPTQ